MLPVLEAYARISTITTTTILRLSGFCYMHCNCST